MHVAETPAPRPRRGAGGLHLGERGIGLFEVMAGSLVATLAVLGLAYSFGVGRGLIDRYQIARSAMSRAQLVVDSLSIRAPSSITGGSEPFWFQGRQAGSTSWTIRWIDDPVDRLQGGSPPDPNPNDLKRIVVKVGWGTAGSNDTLTLSRVVLGS